MSNTILHNPRGQGKSWILDEWERQQRIIGRSLTLTGWGQYTYTRAAPMGVNLYGVWMPCEGDTVVRAAGITKAIVAVRTRRGSYIAAIVTPSGNLITSKGPFKRKEEAQAYADIVYWHRISST